MACKSIQLYYLMSRKRPQVMTFLTEVAKAACTYMEPHEQAMKKQRWQVSAKLLPSPESPMGWAEANGPGGQDLESTIPPAPLPFRTSVHTPPVLFRSREWWIQFLQLLDSKSALARPRPPAPWEKARSVPRESWIIMLPSFSIDLESSFFLDHPVTLS